MVVVAIAGGTGDVGRTFTDEIMRTGKHKVFVLSRSTPVTQAANGPTILQVDYASVNQLKNVLRQNNVEVIVSTMLTYDDNITQSQINLIQAAAKSKTVTKFIPTEYFVDHATIVDGKEMFLQKFHQRSQDELARHPELTWTAIRNGLFLDYLTLPYNPLPTYLKPLGAFLDLTYEICIFPEDGASTIVLTHTTDVAKYVERLISLPANQWPREAFIEGNRIQLKDLVPIMKKISGKDFTVINESAKSIRSGKFTRLPQNPYIGANALPALAPLYEILEQETFFTVSCGGFEKLPGKNLAEIFPDIKPIKLEAFLKEAWEMKEELQMGRTYLQVVKKPEPYNSRI